MSLQHYTHSSYLLHFIDFNSVTYMIVDRYMQCLVDLQLSPWAYRLLLDVCVIDCFGSLTMSMYIMSLTLLQTVEILLYSGFTYLSISSNALSLTNFHWISREIYDWFGFVCLSRIDVRRLFSDYFFSGFPLRKSYPLCGIVEFSYNSVTASVVYTSIESIYSLRLIQLSKTW